MVKYSGRIGEKNRKKKDILISLFYACGEGEYNA